MTQDTVRELSSYWRIAFEDFETWLTPKRSFLISVFAVLIAVAGYAADPFGQVYINTLNSVIFGMVAVQYARITAKLYLKSTREDMEP